MHTSLIEHNPLLKRPLLRMLTLAAENPSIDRDIIEEHAAKESAELFTRQTPTTIVNILIRNEALEEQVYVEGELYEGTLQDVHTDDSIAGEAQIEQILTLTPLGFELINSYSGGSKLRELFAEKPGYVGVFTAMLELCSTEQGCSRAQLEEALNARPELAPNPRTGEQQIYPQYFIDSLETADGIAWQGSWHTTEVGRSVM